MFSGFLKHFLRHRFQKKFAENRQGVNCLFFSVRLSMKFFWTFFWKNVKDFAHLPLPRVFEESAREKIWKIENFEIFKFLLGFLKKLLRHRITVWFERGRIKFQGWALAHRRMSTPSLIEIGPRIKKLWSIYIKKIENIAIFEFFRYFWKNF